MNWLRQQFHAIRVSLDWWANFLTGGLFDRLGGTTVIIDLRPLFAQIWAAIGALTSYADALLTQLIWPFIQAQWAFDQRAAVTIGKLTAALVRLQKVYLPALVKAILHTVDQESASGYEITAADRRGPLASLIGDLAARNPAERELISVLERLALDALEVDNPLIRFAVARAISELAGKLGADSAIAALIGDLTGRLPGGQAPRNLHDVIADLSERLNRVESWQATFMTDGGPEILQAGRDWKGITSVVADGAMLGMFGQMLADPTGWAREVSDTLGTVANDTIIGAEHLIRSVK